MHAVPIKTPARLFLRDSFRAKMQNHVSNFSLNIVYGKYKIKCLRPVRRAGQMGGSVRNLWLNSSLPDLVTEGK